MVKTVLSLVLLRPSRSLATGICDNNIGEAKDDSIQSLNAIELKLSRLRECFYSSIPAMGDSIVQSYILYNGEVIQDEKQ